MQTAKRSEGVSSKDADNNEDWEAKKANRFSAQYFVRQFPDSEGVNVVLHASSLWNTALQQAIAVPSSEMRGTELDSVIVAEMLIDNSRRKKKSQTKSVSALFFL